MSKLSWDSVGKAVADVAPVLGTLFAGPAGGAVGAMIASTLGTSNDPDAILAKIKADPESLLKIKQLESDEREHIRELQIQTLNAELTDIQSARNNNKDHWMPSVLTVFLTLMVCAMTWAVINTTIPAENKDMAVYIFGVVTGAWGSSITYWLGTSRSSYNKDKILAGAQ